MCERADACGSKWCAGTNTEVSVRSFGTTAILLNRIRLVARVRGNDAVNPFNVTEVYVKLDGAWKLASLSFTRLTTTLEQ